MDAGAVDGVRAGVDACIMPVFMLVFTPSGACTSPISAGNRPPLGCGQSARNRNAGEAARPGNPRKVRYTSAGVPAAGSDPFQIASARAVRSALAAAP